jgi:hypothetical protein
MTVRTTPAAAIVALALATPALAQEADRPEAGWRLQLTPYAWLAGLSGDVRPRQGLPTFGTRKSAFDVLEDLDAAFFLNGTLRNRRFVLLGDVSWAALSRTETLRLPTPPLPASVEGRVRQTSATLAAGISALDGPDLTLDLLAGARLWHVDARLDAQVPAGPFRISGRSSHTWADPILAGRIRIRLAPDWSLIGHADIGGFGAASRLTWQVVGTVNYRISERFYASAGYRHLAVDYRRDGLILDVAMSGPLVGLTLRF